MKILHTYFIINSMFKMYQQVWFGWIIEELLNNCLADSDRMCWCLVRLFTCVFSFRTFHMRFLYPADPRPCFPYSSCNDGIWIEMDCWRTQSTGKVDRDGYWERIQPIYLSFLIMPSDNLRIQWENTYNLFVTPKKLLRPFVSGAKIIKSFPMHSATSLQNKICDMTQFCTLWYKLLETLLMDCRHLARQKILMWLCK